MTTIKDILESMKGLSDEITSYKEQLKERYRNYSTFKCKSCNEESQLRKVIFIQSHWYEGPYGCTGGDQWYSGECNLLCPCCGMTHRLLSEESIDEFTKFKYAEPKDVYAVVIHQYEENFYKNYSASEDEKINEYNGIPLRNKMDFKNI